MAAFLICYKTPHKDQNLLTQHVIRLNCTRFTYDCVSMLTSSSILSQAWRTCNPLYKVNNIHMKLNTRQRTVPRSIVHGRGSSHKTATEQILRVCSPGSHLSNIQGCYSKRENLFRVVYSAESSSIEKQLRSLDSYFGRLQDHPKLRSFDLSNKGMQVHHSDGQTRSKHGLDSLDEYLGKLNNEVNQEPLVPPSYDENYSEENLELKHSLNKDTEKPKFRKPNTYVDIRSIKGLSDPRFRMDLQQHDETSSLYLIGILVSVNIAVFLFEMASPIRNADFELFSLPLLYGAKINHLIVVGEWWRLVTPMFLHAGVFHMTLSCWALVTFGPQVCRGYGSFTFFLIYMLGGISGNLTSFLHSPDPTVGGTGPVFAIIGAWLMYKIQNRDVIANDASESMLWKAIIVTALGFILCNLGPIDEWTHSGAAFTGMAYGFLTSPTLQLNDASSAGSGGQEGLKLVRKHGDSCKSLIVFTIFIIVLSSLLFFMEPPLNALA